MHIIAKHYDFYQKRGVEKSFCGGCGGSNKIPRRFIANMSYNKIFWYKNEHPNDIVEEISINTSGVVFLGSPYIEIEVKGRKDGTGDTVRLYYEYSKLNKNDRL